MDSQRSMRHNIFLASVTEEEWLSATLWFIFAFLSSCLRNLIGRLPVCLTNKVTRSLMVILTKGRQGWLYNIAQRSQDGEGGDVAFGE